MDKHTSIENLTVLHKADASYVGATVFIASSVTARHRKLPLACHGQPWDEMTGFVEFREEYKCRDFRDNRGAR